MTVRFHLAVAALALSLVFGTATLAVAQDPQVDPDSPAGTEYQLPTERARQEARRDGGTSAGGSSGASTADEAPLFGEGIGDKKAASAGNPGTDSDPATTAEVEADLGTSTPETVRAQAPAPDGVTGGLVAIAGGAGGVLLLGGLAGLALRRRSLRE